MRSSAQITIENVLVGRKPPPFASNADIFRTSFAAAARRRALRTPGPDGIRTLCLLYLYWGQTLSIQRGGGGEWRVSVVVRKCVGLIQHTIPNVRPQYENSRRNVRHVVTSRTNEPTNQQTTTTDRSASRRR